MKRTKVITINEIARLPNLYRDRIYLPPKLPEDWPYKKGDAKLNSKIGIIKADITKLEIDAIVNAANKTLLGGGGVDGAIHKAAGPGLKEECAKLGGCQVGDAKITEAYKLPCKRIIHTVGPVYKADLAASKMPELLAACYENSLSLLVENDLKSIAFCCVSTAIYGYPNKEAAQVALSTVRKFLESPTGEKVDLVVFCLFAEVDLPIYQEYVPKFFPPAEDGRGEPAKGTAKPKKVEPTKRGEPTNGEPRSGEPTKRPPKKVEPKKGRKPEEESRKRGAYAEAEVEIWTAK